MVVLGLGWSKLVIKSVLDMPEADISYFWIEDNISSNCILYFSRIYIIFLGMRGVGWSKLAMKVCWTCQRPIFLNPRHPSLYLGSILSLAWCAKHTTWNVFSDICSCYFHPCYMYLLLMKMADGSMNLLLSTSWQSSMGPPTLGVTTHHPQTDENIQGSVNWVECQMMMNGHVCDLKGESAI